MILEFADLTTAAAGPKKLALWLAPDSIWCAPTRLKRMFGGSVTEQLLRNANGLSVWIVDRLEPKREDSEDHGREPIREKRCLQL